MQGLKPITSIVFLIFSLLITITNFQYPSIQVFAAPPEAFVISIKTDNPGVSGSTQFSIPAGPGTLYNYNVDCDDDGTNEVVGATGSYTCNYASAGTYNIAITDNLGDGTGFSRIYFNNTGDRQKILSVEQWGGVAWSNMRFAFFGADNMVINAVDTPNLTNVLDFSSMFRGATNLVDNGGRMQDWNTSSVIGMANMFRDADNFDEPIGSWNTSSVRNMASMFRDTNNFNQPIGNWNTSSVVSMASMFRDADNFDQPIGNWNTSIVRNMANMFRDADNFDQPIGNWNTSSVADMREMFLNSVSFNQDLSGLEISSVNDMSDMLSYSGLSIENYDSTLIGWSSQTPQDNVNLGALGLHFCISETQRQSLIDNFLMVISDEGKICNLKIEFDSASYTSVDERTSITGNIIVSSPFDTTIQGDDSIAISLTPDTATQDIDYPSSSVLINLPAGDYTTPKTIPFQIDIIDDFLIEGNESIVAGFDNSVSNNTIVADANSDSATLSIATIVITDDDAGPTQILLSNNSQAEGVGIGTLVGNLSSIDINTPHGDSHTYSLTCANPGDDDNYFDISGNQLINNQQFDFNSPVDANTDNIYDICIVSTDAGGNQYEQNFTITISDTSTSSPSEPESEQSDDSELAITGADIRFQVGLSLLLISTIIVLLFDTPDKIKNLIQSLLE